MPEATYRAPHGQVTKEAAAEVVPGTIELEAAGGRPGVVQGSGRNIVAGEVYTLCCYGVYDVDSASGTTFAHGVTVGWDDVGKLAVTGGTGTFDIGVAAEAKVSGTTKVKVDFNAFSA